MRKKVFYLLAASTVVSPVLATAAGAQTSAGTGLSDIVVTAEKRAESLQNTPISISALDAAALETKRVFGLSDMVADVPNMQVSPHPNSPTTLRVTIRGIGEMSATPTRDAPVAVYVDGVYVAKGQGLSNELAELERVEVLRGPQGTLYGRNATAGAINFITRPPRLNELHAKAQVTFGSRSEFRGRTSLNIPIGETLAAEFAYLRVKKHGFVQNLGTGQDRYGDTDREGVRGALLWQPSPAFEARYTYDSSWIRDTVGFLQQVPLEGQAPRARVASTGDILLRPNASQVQGHNLTLSYEVADSLTVKSITGYRKLRDRTYQVYAPGIRVGVLPFHNENFIDQKQFSEELQLIGEALDGGLKYIGGLYYFSESGNSLDESHMPTTNNPRVAHWNNKAYAVYGQLTWTPDFLDQRLHLTVGGRWSKDKRAADVLSRAFPVAGGPGITLLSGEGKRSFTDFSPTGTIRFDINDTVNIYAKVSKGYKTGGFNPTASSAIAFANGFGPETLVSYEAGLRSEFLDRRIRFNLTAFHSKYTDIQTDVFDPFNNRIFDVINAGRARTQGIEADLAAVLFKGMTLNASYGFTDAKFNKVVDLGGNDVTSLFHFVFAPKHSFSLSADYVAPETAAGTPDFNLNYVWQDKFYPLATKATLQTPAHGVLNGTIGLTDVAGVRGLRVAVWGKNLTNENYYLTEFSIGNVNIAQLGEPRSFGVDLSIAF